MNVRRRLLLFGVMVPAAMFLVAALGAARVFERQLLADVDRELLASAAVESVGAFDGAQGKPHLHLGRSFLRGQLSDSDPRGALYDAELRLVTSDPPGEPPLAVGRFAARDVAGRPQFWNSVASTPSGGSVQRRELAIATTDLATKTPYLLRLSRSLAPRDRAMAAYWRSVGLFFASAVAISLVVWWLLAKWFSQRLRRITARLPAPETAAAQLPEWAPPGEVYDEFGELEVALGHAFTRVREAARAQDQFVAHAAHELKTPMALIRGEIDAALRQPHSPEVATGAHAAMARIRDEIDRLTALSRGLLDLAASERVDIARKPVDVRRMVFDALDHFEVAIARKGLSVAFNAPELVVVSDERLLRSAFDNLLDNAVAHSPSGGHIEINVSQRDAGCDILVRDHGPGIGPAAAARVFEPFYQASPDRRGSGLGLAIAKVAMKRLGGEAHLSDPGLGHGATFGLRVPLSRATLPPQA